MQKSCPCVTLTNINDGIDRVNHVAFGDSFSDHGVDFQCISYFMNTETLSDKISSVNKNNKQNVEKSIICVKVMLLLVGEHCLLGYDSSCWQPQNVMNTE